MLPRRASRTALSENLRIAEMLAKKEYAISPEEVRTLIAVVSNLFRQHLALAGYPERNVRALMTKFRDAGRRSAPWQPTSSRVPGRPQDGADGNRRARWLFEETHKFYASEIDATLVEVKYYLQTLSMNGAPPLPPNSIQHSFIWLLGHAVEPGEYLDPIQLVPIEFSEALNDPRLIQSGHLMPLDRRGRHIPDNTFIMLARSNQLQGNQTLEELLDLMNKIVGRHLERKTTLK